MGSNTEASRRWYALVRVEGLTSGLGLMNVVDAYPTRGEAIKAFLQEPNKHALAIYPDPYPEKLEPGHVLTFTPWKFYEEPTPTWSEDVDRALDESLDKLFTKTLMRIEQAMQAEVEEPTAKVVDLAEYRQRKPGLEQGL